MCPVVYVWGRDRDRGREAREREEWREGEERGDERLR